MKGTEKQIIWATDILNGFDGTTQGNVVGVMQKAGQDKAKEVLGELTPAAFHAFLTKCDAYIRNQDAAWIIEHRDFLGPSAAMELLK
ncbi:MAG: hypothetical protein H6961_11750 [Chromatiaceae bacterium]|nr:hypothetical protein [Chromatiaceae bacterium]